MQDNIPDALITAFERQYDSSWNDPKLRKERLAMRYGWAAAMEAKPCLHQIQEPAPVLVAQPQLHAALFAARGALQHMKEGGKPTQSLLNEAIAAIDSVAVTQAAPAAVAVQLDANGIAQCPLCGSESKHVQAGVGGHRILCWNDDCECSSGYFCSKEEAITSWNARAALATTPQNHIADAGQMVENVREGTPYDNPAFERLARELGVWGTAQSAICAQFWLAATPAAAPVLDLESLTMPKNPHSAAGDPDRHIAWAQGAGAVFATVEAAFTGAPAAAAQVPQGSYVSTSGELKPDVSVYSTPAAAPVVLPEPVATLEVTESADTLLLVRPFRVNTSGLHKLYTEQQVRALLATGGQAQAVEQAPILYVSKGQLDNHSDPDGPDSANAGRYLPCRITPAGKFTTPLFAAPQAQADARDAGRWRMASLIHSEMMKHPDIRAEPEAASAYMKAVHDGVCFEAAIDSAIAAAKEQGQ